MVVGLTGGIGSGKSTVANIFSKFDNVAVYIADIEAKKLMHSSSIIKEQLVQEFGQQSYLNNQLNRQYISKIVFQDKEKLEKLNAIIHPEVRKHFFEYKELNADKDYILYEAAILFEAKADVLCDKIITIFVDEKTRLKRVIERDKTTKLDVKNRMKNQWKDQKKIMLSNYIILNYDLTETSGQIHKIHNFLTKTPR